jgi:hypothetical protein
VAEVSDGAEGKRAPVVGPGRREREGRRASQMTYITSPDESRSNQGKRGIA